VKTFAILMLILNLLAGLFYLGLGNPRAAAVNLGIAVVGAAMVGYCERKDRRS
jgi:hypothetical protein